MRDSLNRPTGHTTRAPKKDAIFSQLNVALTVAKDLALLKSRWLREQEEKRTIRFHPFALRTLRLYRRLLPLRLAGLVDRDMDTPKLAAESLPK